MSTIQQHPQTVVTISVCSYEDATALVTMGEGKFYSLGLDLVGLAGLSAVEIQQFADDLQKMLLRLLTFPLVTVAAINGESHVWRVQNDSDIHV